MSDQSRSVNSDNHQEKTSATHKETPRIFAHRGSAVLAPENTRPAFDLALQHDASVLETDVRTSKDGVPVIHHDAKLDRTTDGQGFVSNYTLQELKQLDAGYHFRSLSGDSFRGKGITILTLEEMLELYRDTEINVEIKHPKPEFAKTVATVIQNSGRADSVTVASFHSGVTEAFRIAAPNINTAATREEIRQQFYRQFSPGNLFKRFFDKNQQTESKSTNPRSAYSTLQIPTQFKFVGIAFELTDADFIDYLHQQGLTVTYWTINNVEEMVLLANRGADGIVTDRPDLAAKVFGL